MHNRSRFPMSLVTFSLFENIPMFWEVTTCESSYLGCWSCFHQGLHHKISRKEKDIFISFTITRLKNRSSYLGCKAQPKIARTRSSPIGVLSISPQTWVLARWYPQLPMTYNMVWYIFNIHDTSMVLLRLKRRTNLDTNRFF